MQLDENDLAFFYDILECIEDIENFISGISYHQFESDKMRKLAVERQLEVIGQAANGISRDTQEAISEIPWGLIIGLRNKLAHDYGEILTERIWDISQKHIRPLKKSILDIKEVETIWKDRNVT